MLVGNLNLTHINQIRHDFVGSFSVLRRIFNGCSSAQTKKKSILTCYLSLRLIGQTFTPSKWTLDAFIVATQQRTWALKGQFKLIQVFVRPIN